MGASDVIFYLLAAMTVTFAVLSVTTRQIFRAAIYLLFTLIGVAGIYFWMQFEFIAAVQIVVYVGGIVVLIIFSILLTQQAGEKMAQPPLKRKLFSALAAICGAALILVQVLNYTFKPTTETAIATNVKSIGTQLMNIDATGWALPFEVISILLLASMVGCIVIAMREKGKLKI